MIKNNIHIKMIIIPLKSKTLIIMGKILVSKTLNWPKGPVYKALNLSVTHVEINLQTEKEFEHSHAKIMQINRNKTMHVINGNPAVLKK